MSVAKFEKEDPGGHVTNAKFTRGVTTLREDILDTAVRDSSNMTRLFVWVSFVSVVAILILDGRATRSLIRELYATQHEKESPVGQFIDAREARPIQGYSADTKTNTQHRTTKKRNVVR